MNRRSLRHKKRLFLFFLLLSPLYTFSLGAIFNNLPPKVLASESAVVAVDPPTTTAEPDEYFTINVTVTDVVDLYNWAARISWPAAVLGTHEDNVTEGPFLPQGGTTSFTKKAYLSYMDVGSVLLGAVPGVTGSGTLATIKFKVLGSGNCTLRLDPTRTTLYNSTFGLINCTLQDGYFYTNSPVAKFTYTPHPIEYYGRPIVGETVTFNATASYDPDEPYDATPGGIVGYEWDFGDDATGSGSIAAHVYNEPGSYIVSLNVTDDEGKKDFTTRDEYGNPSVRIQLHDISIINVTVTPTTFTPGTVVTINVTVLNRGSATERLNITIYKNFNPVNTTLFRYLDVVIIHGEPTYVWAADLESEENATGPIGWDTTGVHLGDYTLGVYAFLIEPTTKESVPGIERDEVLIDNWMTFGTVTATGEATHDIAATDIRVDPTDLKIEEYSDIEVKVENEGNIDEHYNATLTILYGSEPFKQRKWSNQPLKAGTTDRLEYKNWLQGANTTKEGDYNITATVILVNTTTLDFLEPYNATVPDDDPTDNMLSVSASIRMLPVASFKHSPSQPLVDTPITFNASASYTPGIPVGNISEYSWEFGDGTSVVKTSPVATHVYRLSGRYTVNLTITDDSHQTSFEKTDVTVLSDMAHILMNVTFSPSVAMPGESVSVRVTVRNVGYLEETFNVTAYYDDDEIGREENMTLESGASTTLTFTWDTTGVPLGYYTVKTVASKLIDGGLVENTCIGGTVAIGVGGMVPTGNVTISASPSSLNIGASATISGSISPVSAGERVIIYFRLREAAAWSNLSMVITDQDGKYEYPWEPQKIGIYALKSILLGEDATLIGESKVEIMVVEESAPLNVFFYTTIALGAGLAAAVAAMAIFYLAKVRKGKPG